MIIESFAEADRIDKLYRLISGDCDLKRNDDLLRTLMFEIELEPDPIFLFPEHINMPQEDRIKYFHLRLLSDEGLLEETHGGGVFRITNKGHDFIAAVRSDDIWGKTKKAASSVAGVSVSMLKDIAFGYVRQELVGRGIPFG